jgi:hypothetical protein
MLGGVSAIAHTVVRIVPPAPMHVGVIGRAAGPSYLGLMDITVEVAEGIPGSLGGGFVRRVQEWSGCSHIGFGAEPAGCWTKVLALTARGESLGT